MMVIAMISLSKRGPIVLGIVAGALMLGAGAGAQGLSVQQSFRIGSGTGTLCTAESQIQSPAYGSMFDRGYRIVCRDAAVPVGQLYALRTRGADPAPRLAALRAATATCQGSETARIEGLGEVEALRCRLNEADVAWRVYLYRRGRSLYVAEGLGGYDSALQLGLRSLAADRAVEGEVQVATTGAGDPAAFARVQAGAQDPQRALAEAYRRNNAGAYAEAQEYFAQLGQRDTGPGGRAEALVNEALQRS